MSKPATPKNSNFTGPPEVIPWLKVTRDSPVELDRKFGYIVGWHEKLAVAERRLKEAVEEKASRAVLRERRAVVENDRAWLNFCVSTLTNHVRHALARIEPDSPDGKLLREQGAQRKRCKRKKISFRKPAKNAAKKIRHYAAVLEEYKLAKAAAAGHSGSNDALLKLIQHANNVIQSLTNSSYREKEDAENAAILGLLKAAKSYNPSHGQMARFNTYAWWKARRAMESRASKDCKPGLIIVYEDGEKKLKSIASIDAPPPNKDTAGDAHHPSVETNHGARMDVRRAIEALPEEEKAAAVGVLMEEKSIRQVARETGITARRLRLALERATDKLRHILSAHGG